MKQPVDEMVSAANGNASPTRDKNSTTCVRFSNVDVIEFPYTIGYTPCSSGVPIATSIVAQKRTSFQLEFFEAYRPKRRLKSDLHMSPNDRKAL
jgi:hypothetical protein